MSVRVGVVLSLMRPVFTIWVPLITPVLTLTTIRTLPLAGGSSVPSVQVTGLPAPVLSNAGSTAVAVAATAYSGRVTQQTANWTYSFANSVTPAAGRYTGQVTYTAAAP